MPTSISDHLGLDPEALEAVGAFDAIVDVDTRLFIDPFLVRQSEVPEFATAGVTLDQRFTDLILLLGRSAARGDTPWRTALGLLTFREPAGLSIGYSRNSTAGLGIGEVLRDRLLTTAKEIVDAGINDPRFFELMGLLEEGIGADRISDMTARILSDEIGAYSERVFTDLEVEREAIFRVSDRAYRLPANPFNDLPVLLIPKDVLRPLPVAESWSDIDTVITFNEELRLRVNEVIGRTWKKARYLPKGVLRERLLADPELFRSILDTYKGVRGAAYDFAADPLGEVLWYSLAKSFAERFPLRLLLPREPNGDDITRLVVEISHAFKQHIEDHGLWRHLYNDDGSVRPEPSAGLLFYAIAWEYCTRSDVNVAPQTDSGRGSVDFEFSRGMGAKTVTELKLTSNSKLVTGATVQLELYARSAGTDQKVYVVIHVEGTGNARRLEALKEAFEELRQAARRLPVLVEINGRPKPSASVATSAD